MDTYQVQRKRLEADEIRRLEQPSICESLHGRPFVSAHHGDSVLLQHGMALVLRHGADGGEAKTKQNSFDAFWHAAGIGEGCAHGAKERWQMKHLHHGVNLVCVDVLKVGECRCIGIELAEVGCATGTAF